MLGQMAMAAGALVSLPLWAKPALAGAEATEATEAYGTASKAAVQYQDHPKGTSECSNCANFIPGKTAKDAGHCTIVAGTISPQAWCLAYAGN